MACTLYCRIVLNQRFSTILNESKRYGKVRKKYYSILRECISLLFSRLNYPYNILKGGEMLEFGVLKADENEASVLVKVELNLPPFMEKKEIERNVKSYNMIPEFIKKVKVVKMSFL